MTLEEALKTGNETAEFCLYGKDGPTTVKAAQAKDMLEIGEWFRSPGEAEEAFLKTAPENAAKEKAEKKAERKAEKPAIQSPPKPAKREKAIKRAVKSKKKVRK